MGHTGGELLFHREEPAEVAWPSVWDVSWMCSIMSHQEETPKTQDTLVGLGFSAGLETPWGPAGRSGGGDEHQGSLDSSPQTKLKKPLKYD